MLKKIDVILLSGGKGTRFREVTHDKIPKPLYKVNDLELIKYSIHSLDFSLVNNLIFAVDHHADMVQEWAEEQNFPVNVVFSYQREPGVFGAVDAALRYVETDYFLVSNTDEIREGLMLEELLAEHMQSNSLATMALAPVDHLYRHRVIGLNEEGLVVVECHEEGAIEVGNNNTFYPGTYILCSNGKITIGNNNDFGPSGLTIKANFPDAVITVGDGGRYSDGASIMGRSTLGSGSQVLGNITVQSCVLGEGASFTELDPDKRGAVLKGMGLARNLTLTAGQVINGLGDFSKAPIEQQSFYHPKKV